jgi:hypothetical protein
MLGLARERGMTLAGIKQLFAPQWQFGLVVVALLPLGAQAFHAVPAGRWPIDERATT